jgi:hypothetical protein
MISIVSMLRFGRFWAVTLACGHKFRAGPEEVKRDQLTIGKMIECAECRAGK